jgi:hypothetical protein
LHFDTEQSVEDHWHQINRAVVRAGRTVPPPWLWSYCLTGFDPKQARAAAWGIFEKAAQQFGGIFAASIDGFADLVSDVNDPEACNDLVASLHALAIKYDCPISGVIHFNPGSEKTRGHLGSQLERKSETNLRLDKDSDITSVWSEKQRRAPIVKGQGPRFRWDDTAKMHVSVQAESDARSVAKTADAINLRDEVFAGKESMRYTEIEKGIMRATGKSEATAKRMQRQWDQAGIILKTPEGAWKRKL